MSKVIIFIVIILLTLGGFVLYQYAQQQQRVTDVTIKDHTFKSIIVSTPQDMQKGLSGRDSLTPDQAMMFIFEEQAQHAFWMKEMRFPIDIIFIRDNEIVSIAKNAPAPKSPDEELTIYRPEEPANRVLEINAGLSDEYGFAPGDEVLYQLPGEPEPTQAPK